jgi:outer membrane lipoprotein SlyB
MKTTKIIASVLFAATAFISATSAFAQNDPYGGNIYYGEPGEAGYRGTYPVNMGPVNQNQAQQQAQYNVSSVNSPAVSALDGTMAISDFKVEPQGNEIRFTVAGHPNAQVKVKFANRAITLTENRAGIYTGSYIVGSQDTVGQHFDAQMSLKEGKKVHTYNMYQTFGNVVANVPNVPTQQAYQPPYTWTSRYEEAGGSNYRPYQPNYNNYGYRPQVNTNNIGQVVDIRVEQVPVQRTSVVGGLVGGGAGGLLGSTIGRGNGRLWATGIGAATGAMVGNQVGGQGYQNVWAVVVQFQSGNVATYAFGNQPPVQLGSVVQRVGNGIAPVNMGSQW